MGFNSAFKGLNVRSGTLAGIFPVTAVAKFPVPDSMGNFLISHVARCFSRCTLLHRTSLCFTVTHHGDTAANQQYPLQSLNPIMTATYKRRALDWEEIRKFYVGMSCRNDELYNTVLRRTYATSQKVARSIPGGAIGNFH